MAEELLIFQHMPKTAGTSLREVMLANYASEDVLLLYYGDERTGRPPPRRRAEYEEWYATLDPDVRARLRVVASHSASFVARLVDRPHRIVTLLRNPIDRLASLYTFTKQQAKRDRPPWQKEIGTEILARGWSLADIYRNLGGTQPSSSRMHELFAEFFNGQTRRVLRPWDRADELGLWAGQPDEAAGPKQAALELLSHKYVVGVQERFELSLDLFAEAFGWSERSLPRVNVGEPEALDPETRELVAAHNEIDAQLHAHFDAALGRRARERAEAAQKRPARARASSPNARLREQEAVCILGAHRSGTSLTANVINVLGVELGPEDELMPPQPAQNPAGFWEHEGLVQLNEDVLASVSERPIRGGQGWRETILPPDDWHCRASLAPLRYRARELLSRAFGGSGRWGWKDPRTSLTLPFWQLLVPHLKYVICVRHPLDVASSLYHRDGMLEQEALDLWLRYSAAAVVHTRDRPRIFVAYERWFDSWRTQLERLARFLGIEDAAEGRHVAAAVRVEVDAELWHHRSDVDAELPPDVRSLYSALEHSAADEVPASLDRIAEEIDAAAR
jgi:Sulfotransferase family